MRLSKTTEEHAKEECRSENAIKTEETKKKKRWAQVAEAPLSPCPQVFIST